MRGENLHASNQEKTSWAEHWALFQGTCVRIFEGESKLQYPAQDPRLFDLDKQDTNPAPYMAMYRSGYCSSEEMLKRLDKSSVAVFFLLATIASGPGQVRSILRKETTRN